MITPFLHLSNFVNWLLLNFFLYKCYTKLCHVLNQTNKAGITLLSNEDYLHIFHEIKKFYYVDKQLPSAR